MSVVVITGANRGLGLEMARQYLSTDARVYTLSRSGSEELAGLAENPLLSVIEADITCDTSLQEAVKKIDSPVVDILLNNAGTMGKGSFAAPDVAFQPFGSFDREEWLQIYNINVCTPMAVTELLVDKLAAASGARVATLSSMVGSNAWNTIGNLYPYRASKAAVNSMMKSMGINLLERGIIAVAIQPGWVRTDMGGPAADLDATESIEGVRKTIAALTLEDAGKLFTHDGHEAPY